jgi:hypothetical protein
MEPILVLEGLEVLVLGMHALLKEGLRFENLHLLLLDMRSLVDDCSPLEKLRLNERRLGWFEVSLHACLHAWLQGSNRRCEP